MGSCTSKSVKKVDDKENQANARSGIGTVFFVDELAAASNNFSNDCLLGRGQFGSVFVGLLKRNGQVVAIKKLPNNADSDRGYAAFLTEARMLTELRHPNLVSVIGFCAQGIHRLLVLEYMPRGSLADHLFRCNSKMVPIDWNTRMKIALSVAQGLEYLHLKHDPSVIHGGLNCSNVLLKEGHLAKLSDFGLAKGLVGESRVTAAIAGTTGYIAPECATTRRFTAESDIYAFGVVLLEIITGRRFDDCNFAGVKDLVGSAVPYSYIDHDNISTEIADPSLQGRYPTDQFVRVAALAVKCVLEDPDIRPHIDEIGYELTNLSEASIQ